MYLFKCCSTCCIHVLVFSLQITIVPDEWKLWQTEHIPEDWYANADQTAKRIDSFWAKVFDIKSAVGEKKYVKLKRVYSPLIFQCLMFLINQQDIVSIYFCTSALPNVFRNNKSLISLDQVESFYNFFMQLRIHELQIYHPKVFQTNSSK